LKNLTAMDRHVIANMGTELGATTTVFPSDAAVRKFLASATRGRLVRNSPPTVMPPMTFTTRSICPGWNR
jgi:aconitase A